MPNYSVRILNGVAVALCLLALTVSSQAQVLFNNFGPGDTYQTGLGWTISTAASATGADFTQGDQFSPSSTANLDSIDIAISHVSGLNHVDLDLLSDSGGSPGALIEAFSVDNMQTFGNAGPPFHVASVSHPLLTAGTPYWLVAAATADTWAAWNENSTGGMGPHVSNSIVTTDTQGAFRVNGSAAVPEPGALSMLGGLGGLVGLTLLRRKRS